MGYTIDKLYDLSTLARIDASTWKNEDTADRQGDNGASSIPREIVAHILSYIDAYLPTIIFPSITPPPHVSLGAEKKRLAYLRHADWMIVFIADGSWSHVEVARHHIVFSVTGPISLKPNGIIAGYFLPHHWKGTTRDYLYPRRSHVSAIRMTHDGIVTHTQKLGRGHRGDEDDDVDSRLGGYTEIYADGYSGYVTVPVESIPIIEAAVERMKGTVAVLRRLRYL